MNWFRYKLRRLELRLLNLRSSALAFFGLHPPPIPRRLLGQLYQAQSIRILILCQGNICRSPYAEARLRQKLHESDLTHVEVSSAGISTTPGKPADRTALTVASNRKVQLLSHRTNSADLPALSAANLILSMEPTQLRWVARKNKTLRGKSILLGRLGTVCGTPLIIEDPYGRTESDFERCFDNIDACLDRLVAVLREIGDGVK